jgi:hypothetical protein
MNDPDVPDRRVRHRCLSLVRYRVPPGRGPVPRQMMTSATRREGRGDAEHETAGQGGGRRPGAADVQRMPTADSARTMP